MHLHCNASITLNSYELPYIVMTQHITSKCIEFALGYIPTTECWLVTLGLWQSCTSNCFIELNVKTVIASMQEQLESQLPVHN